MITIVLACFVVVILLAFLLARYFRPTTRRFETAQRIIELPEAIPAGDAEEQLHPEPPPARGQDQELPHVEPVVGNGRDLPVEIFRNEHVDVDSDSDEDPQENHAEPDVFHDANSIENVSAVLSDIDVHMEYHVIVDEVEQVETPMVPARLL